ncbi:MAG: replication initiator protein A [Oscillospiraceae bacterium]|nr:replication initiator protein A [Oscillospiraceae bacterium]
MAAFEFLYGASAEHFRFLRIPKALLEDPTFRKLPHFLDDLIVYSEMLDLASLSKKRGLVDEKNRVYIVCQNDEVQQWLDVGVNMPTKIISELEKFGLIQRRRRSQDSMYYVMDFANKVSTGNDERPEVKKPRRKRKSHAKTVNHEKRECNLPEASITENVNHGKRDSRESCFTKSVGVNHEKRDCEPRKAWITPSYTSNETYIETDFIDTPVEEVKKNDEKFFEDVRNAFVEECPSLKEPLPAAQWSSKRKDMIADKHLNLDAFRKVFRMVATSDFLTGKKPSSTGTLFCATLEWTLQPEHWESIAEGKYDNREKFQADSSLPSYDLDAYERESLKQFETANGNMQRLQKWDGDEGVG